MFHGFEVGPVIWQNPFIFVTKLTVQLTVTVALATQFSLEHVCGAVAFRIFDRSEGSVAGRGFVFASHPI